MGNRSQASAYRFGDCAAINSGDGETRYLRAKAARALARRLNQIARSIETEAFHENTVGGTLTVESFSINSPQMHQKETRK